MKRQKIRARLDRAPLSDGCFWWSRGAIAGHSHPASKSLTRIQSLPLTPHPKTAEVRFSRCCSLIAFVFGPHFECNWAYRLYIPMGKRTLHRPRRRSSGEFKAAFYLTTSPPISVFVGCWLLLQWWGIMWESSHSRRLSSATSRVTGGKVGVYKGRHQPTYQPTKAGVCKSRRVAWPERLRHCLQGRMNSALGPYWLGGETGVERERERGEVRGSPPRDWSCGALVCRAISQPLGAPLLLFQYSLPSLHDDINLVSTWTDITVNICWI